MIKYCKRCITPTTRPGLILDNDGICQGCRYFETLKEIDWDKRKAELNNILKWARDKKSPQGYDAIVSVSGGKDSLRQALYARDSLGLNVLLVSTRYPPEKVTEVGVRNFDNLVSLGFDTISITPNPEIYKKLMKKCFYEYGNIYKASESIVYASAHKIAIMYDIPLILLGENGSLVYGDKASNKDGGIAKNIRNNNTIGGGDLSIYIDEELDIKEEDLNAFEIPYYNDEDLKVIYLGYYMKDFSQITNAVYAMTYGLDYIHEPLNKLGTIYNFGQTDTDFMPMNQLIKFYKFGFGKASEDLSELIKLGIMSRETAIELAKTLDGKCDRKYILMFCDYIGISEKEFWEVAEKYRNQDIWKKNKYGKWELDSEFYK
ncbi:MAG: N-acetyl sugar amidotransferase [Campylobacteraceae bacterium]|nr:N-acetyl sugar amidotransferase [Campylobacteraceae bacterium]